jgi:hypothetical protein
VTSSLRDLKVYTTYPHRCSYLEQEEATTLFIDPRQSVDQTLYSNLSLLGFRRSGNHIYRPHCSHCNACIPARVPVAEFRPTAAQRRCWRATRIECATAEHDIATTPATPLRALHRAAPRRRRHVPAGPRPVRIVPQRSLGLHGVLGVLCGDELLASPWWTRCSTACRPSTRSTNPRPRARSLGRFAILWQIERCRERGLPYVYLGYWIRNCRKMAYKADYQPLETDGQQPVAARHRRAYREFLSGSPVLP